MFWALYCANTHNFDTSLGSHHIPKPALKSKYVDGASECCLNWTLMNLSFGFPFFSTVQLSSMGGDALSSVFGTHTTSIRPRFLITSLNLPWKTSTWVGQVNVVQTELRWTWVLGSPYSVHLSSVWWVVMLWALYCANTHNLHRHGGWTLEQDRANGLNFASI